MVTKGIITSIDFNGNTCQVRIPLFETAGNDPITGTAIVSNTPGSYNGYKVGDVVLVAFEDGKMQNPVIVGKLYLGAAKEKQDPRGTINVETTTASKSASLPADAILTANVDSNVPNTNTPFGSLASIANNLNSLNTDVNQLDRFTRNQFNSVITDVNDQGEQLRSEIKQTAKNIEAAVVHKHQDGSQEGLGWDLTTDSWKINAQDTVNGEAKDINIVTIDRGGMSIAGDLKLNGYPKNIIIRYAQNDSDKNYPDLYSFKAVSFPSTPIDKTWYYGKYIKIEEKYVLIFKENFEDYSITVGTTEAYNREIYSEWKTETPARVDGKYIWQWTHTEIYLFDGVKWIEKDDDKIVCITGAKGDTGVGVSECVTYYSLSNISGGPKANDDNIVSEPEVNKWSTSPQAFDKTKHQDYIYWTVERRVYTDPAKIVWGTPVKASMLSVDFIDSLGITTKKITVRQDNANDKSAILFEADGLSNEGTVKIGGFDVKDNTLTATDAISTNSVQIMPDKISMQATKSAYWLKNTKTVAEAKATYSYTYLFKRLGVKDSNAISLDGYAWDDFSKKYSESKYDYNIYSGDSPENNLVVVPFVDIYNKVTKDVEATFYYSYSHAGTPYLNLVNGLTRLFELWIEKPKVADSEPRRLLVKNGTTVINDGNYEYRITDFIKTNSENWAELASSSIYSNYLYPNCTTYYDNYESSSQFNGKEYSYLQLKITKDIPTTFNIYLGISSNFNIAQNFDTVIALEPTDIDKAADNSPDFEFDAENGYAFKDTANYVLKASTSGNYVSGSLEDLVKVTYPSITLDSRTDPNTNEVIKDPKYIYILYVNRNNTQSTEAIDSGTGTTSIATAGFCVVPNLITYSDSKLSIGPNFNVTPNGQLTAKNAIFEDNMTVIGGGKLGAFELNNNSLTNSAATWDHNGISLKDYKYLSIGNTEQFRLFKSRIDKSYVNFGESTTTTSTDTTVASTNTNEMVDVSYLQSYYPIIIQKLLPSPTDTPSGQSATSTLPGASILLTANETTITQYFHITAEVKSTKPIVESGGSNIGGGIAIRDEYGNTGVVVAGKRYNIDFKVTIVDKAGTPVEDEAGAAKKDYNFKFSAMFSVNSSTVAKTVSVRVPKGRLTATANYSWPIRGTRTSFMGIKNIGGSTIKETLTLTETFTDSVVGSSAIQLSSSHIYLNGDTDLNGTTNLNGTTYLNGTKLEGSDRNLKENIKYLDSHADYLNVFNYLKPVEFNYKNNSLTQFGFIAQDILEALPLLDETKKYSLVVKDNDHYAVDYNSIIALNTLQIKYLTNKLSQLETAYNELLKKVETK